MTIADFEGSEDASFLNTVAGNPSSLESFDNVEFSIFPNPVRNNATLNINLIEKTSNVRIDIVNILGKINLTTTLDLNTGSNSVDLDVSDLINGIYFVHITANGVTETMKFTISK